jgi:hypothetical protein
MYNSGLYTSSGVSQGAFNSIIKETISFTSVDLDTNGDFIFNHTRETNNLIMQVWNNKGKVVLNSIELTDAPTNEYKAYIGNPSMSGTWKIVIL